jgi:hypothetical protein
MPFFRAKRSQVVSALGGGRGCGCVRLGQWEMGVGNGLRTFSRGNGVLMGGRERRTPEGVDAMGHVLRSWFKSAWAPSRAVAERSSSMLP